MAPARIARALAKTGPAVSPDSGPDTLALIDEAVRERLARHIARRPLVIGLCGAQGSGKSTVAAGLKALLDGRGLKTAILSLDDLYLSKEDREVLASSVHPLLKTRGVPGTHDVRLGEKVLDDLRNPGETLLPRFNKAIDSPCPRDAWDAFEGPAAVVIFEGWCVGARPQDGDDLARSVNALEATEDSDCRWRRWVNDQLSAHYQQLFARVDMLVLLAAPDFQVVAAWRSEQEQALRRSLSARGIDASQTLSDDDIAIFIQHYQRLTEHIIMSMPGYADIVVRLDKRRRPLDQAAR